MDLARFYLGMQNFIQCWVGVCYKLFFFFSISMFQNFTCRVLGLPWLTAFLSVVRYLINYQSTNEIPHKEIKKWYLMSTGVISCLVGIIVSYHLVTESDLLTDFCTLVNSSDPSFVTTLVTKDAIRFVHVLIFLIGACLGFTFDFLFKCFVNWQTNEGEELGIDIQSKSIFLIELISNEHNYYFRHR